MSIEGEVFDVSWFCLGFVLVLSWFCLGLLMKGFLAYLTVKKVVFRGKLFDRAACRVKLVIQTKKEEEKVRKILIVLAVLMIAISMGAC
ncbi:MAG: hypothetical protein JXB24_00245, partial [Bacteroidales bacterium]|nr:hypothetical protein [Bacteroidales bacterium]